MDRQRDEIGKRVQAPLPRRTKNSATAFNPPVSGSRTQVPGMLVNAEIHRGTRPVIEYLLSPIQKVTHEAGRERKQRGN